MNIKKFTGVFVTGASLTALGGCSGLLDVQDPSRFTDEDLDGALAAVANGVEGLLNGMFDGLTINSAIMGDEMQHTGTWAGWDDTDHGRLLYKRDGRSDFGSSRHLLRARFAAQDALDRFDRVGNASASLYAQVEVVEGWTDLLIQPPYTFRALDALITNFHLPRSTLLALVFALAGRDRVLRAYEEAIREGYRFYSYGDAMLIV